MKYIPHAIALSLAATTQVIASPWITHDQAALKHSIDLLVSHNIINRPVNQYPLLWQGIVQDLATIDEANLTPQSHFALQHLKHALQQAKRAQYSSIKAQYNSESDLPNGFGARHAARSGLNTYGIITGANVSAKLNVNYTHDAQDEKHVNHHGSHLAILYGNWALSAERLNYWWGPANENALLLSNHAAPMKALRLSRANSNYEGPNFLSFIGPWQVTAIAAKQKPLLTRTEEGDFWGIRLSSTPIAGLELAFNSTHSDFVYTQLDPVNNPEQTTKTRLTSIDFKYSTTLKNQPISVYGELAGNNDNGISSKHNSVTLGAETFFGDVEYRVKAYLEYSDSTTNCQAQQVSFQCNFDNINNGSDYTERDLWLGAAIGPQAKSITLAADHYQMSGVGGYAKLKHIDFEHTQTKRILLEAGYQQGLLNGLAKLGVTVWQDDNAQKESDIESAVKISWEFQF